MSAFREALRTLLVDTLVCPGCHAVNRPGVAYIEISEDAERAECMVCNRYGPIAAFQPTKGTT